MLKIIKGLNLILVLCLLVFNSKADESRKALDKDVSSGYTNLTKSLKGKDYKDYNSDVTNQIKKEALVALLKFSFARLITINAGL